MVNLRLRLRDVTCRSRNVTKTYPWKQGPCAMHHPVIILLVLSVTALVKILAFFLTKLFSQILLNDRTNNLILGDELSSRIVGGQNAEIGFFPYQASIKSSNGKHICNGAIISANTILTVAHCVYRKRPSSLSVTVGTNRLSIGGSVYYVKEVKIHEKYNSWNLRNDIAVLKLMNEISMNGAAYPIFLGDSFVNGGVACVLSGWGFRQESGPVSEYLQYVFLETLNNNECSKQLSTTIEESQMCTFTKIGEGSCYQDSGSPLVADGVLIAVVTSGHPCAEGYPDIYTRVSYFHKWITDNSS
ncbi:hypothetical protein FQA39_LY18734 [Lamprigera yunnana]|nr:hypothetical protein FQA39_LY18734 [Lamprigera yunnana]